MPYLTEKEQDFTEIFVFFLHFITPAKLIRPFEVLKGSFSCLSKPYSIS